MVFAEVEAAEPCRADVSAVTSVEQGELLFGWLDGPEALLQFGIGDRIGLILGEVDSEADDEAFGAAEAFVDGE